MKQDNAPKLRESTAALLLSAEGQFILQQRDSDPNITDPGKISLFGGHREGDESFLDCVVREVREEIGLYLPPERFELLGRYHGPDYFTPGYTLHGEVFLARDVPIDRLVVTEGALKIVTMEELRLLQPLLAAPARFALDIFLEREQTGRQGDGPG